MRTKATLLCLAALLTLHPLSADSQMSTAPKAAATAGATATPAAAFDAQLTYLEGEMMAAAKAMPADKYSFGPSSAIFASTQQPQFTGVRTFAQQATHVAQANFFFFSSISGLKPDVDMAGIAKLTAKDDIVRALGESFAFAHKAIATLTPTNVFEVIPSDEPGMQTRGTLVSFGVSHGFDHYGQMVEYLRMNGIVPPGSAK